MDNQQAFDKIVKHLRKQGVKSISPAYGQSYRSYYRGPHGLKCPIGILIPNRVYKKEFEKMPLESIKALLPRLKDVSISLLHDLQWLHDVERVIDWEYSFEQIANRYSLNFTRRR